MIKLSQPRKGNVVYQGVRGVDDTTLQSERGSREEGRWEARTGVAHDAEDMWRGLTDNKVYKDTGRREMEAQNLRTLRKYIRLVNAGEREEVW